jgi:hypothetical protein
VGVVARFLVHDERAAEGADAVFDVDEVGWGTCRGAEVDDQTLAVAGGGQRKRLGCPVVRQSGDREVGGLFDGGAEPVRRQAVRSQPGSPIFEALDRGG